MALDFAQMKDDMATAIGAAVAAASTASFSTLAVSALGIPATWNGILVVSCPDTSQVIVGNFVKATPGTEEGSWFQVSVVDPDVSFTIIDFFDVGIIPFGGAPADLIQTLVWDGTTTILASDTSGIVAGDSIRLNTDSQFFFVLKVVTNTSILISSGGLTVPSGFTTSSIAQSSRTAQALPAPPDEGKVKDAVGTPIAEPVVDEGIQVLSTSPHELPSFKVIELSALNPDPGNQVFVNNAAGGSIPAFWDGFAWRRVDTRAVVT